MSQQNSDPGAEIDALMNAYSSPAQRGEDALDAAAMGTGSEDRPTYKKQPRQPALNPEETYQSEAEQVEEEQEEAPVEEAPVEEKPDPYAEYEEPAEAEEEEMDELTQLKEQNKKLMQLLNNAVEESYQEQAQAQQRPLGTEEETEEDEQVRRSLPHAPIVPLLDDETFEQVTSDPKEFQKYLNGVVSAVQESSASIIPQAIHRILNTRTRMAAFFRKPENSDILPMMDYVRRVGLRVHL